MLLPERPFGCFAQKSPDPFFPRSADVGATLMGSGNLVRQVVRSVGELDYRPVGIGAGVQSATIIIRAGIDGCTQVPNRVQLAAGGVSALDNRAIRIRQLSEATASIVGSGDGVSPSSNG